MNSKCLETDCFEPVIYKNGKSTGYCDKHQRTDDYWKMVWHPQTNRDPIPGWERTRKEILRRDKATCKRCGTRNANHVDHITPIWKGGSNLHTNLQTLCETCHTIKTAEELKEKTKLKRTPKIRGKKY